ncbi:2,3-diketo-5-methylthio-1-phosphopentane phosphatase [Neokomagataea thailandica NBRC 106555]|uniref:Enolase-phosphatase E1 n=2 Tax=Neokomagataea TaxID=1223423 RepID=A0A4Y6V343_9PROT|nr:MULTISPECIES: acireductone synthase [Neokomagataea]QDH24413.1 acireductone synthase [Neokomagataea tanensis]GBR50881.1 2,3-diketo-5-methylthio-1-phosphopentane phosphatase [Neokomagataea thailandica NBRC 106555]
MIRFVLLDIEGTTLPITFVKDVMFPYAARALPAVLADQSEPTVANARREIERSFPGRDPLDVCQEWMARDEKAAPLKALQGVAWRQGFADGTIRADLYADVLPALKAWKDAGLGLAVYSSGSIPSQKLLYGHTAQGDVTSLFEGFFDLSTGGKKDATSYVKIAQALNVEAGEILFLSDIGAELDAAIEAGLAVCQLVRPQDATVPHVGVPQAATLAEVAANFGLAGSALA